MHASVNAATPLVIDDLVFLSTSYNTGAILLRVKGSDVEKIWAADDVLSNHYATSVYHDGYLYGFDGRQEHGARLRCVELKSGKVRWTQESLGAGTVTLADNRLLVLTERGELIRLRHRRRSSSQPTAQSCSTVRAYPALADGLSTRAARISSSVWICEERTLVSAAFHNYAHVCAAASNEVWRVKNCRLKGYRCEEFRSVAFM
jgi:hypothetical protein